MKTAEQRIESFKNKPSVLKMYALNQALQIEEVLFGKGYVAFIENNQPYRMYAGDLNDQSRYMSEKLTGVEKFPKKPTEEEFRDICEKCNFSFRDGFIVIGKK